MVPPVVAAGWAGSILRFTFFGEPGVGDTGYRENEDPQYFRSIGSAQGDGHAQREEHRPRQASGPHPPDLRAAAPGLSSAPRPEAYHQYAAEASEAKNTEVA